MIGRAVVPRLRDVGWDVTLGSRGEREHAPGLEGARFAPVDRREPGSLERAVADGADVLVDVLAMRPADAEQLLGLAGRVGSLVAISTASVYAGTDGRVLDDMQGPDDFPDYPVPIPESQPTAPPGESTYSREKAAMERLLLEQDALPATVVRPCAIHGPGDRQAREWFFVKRALDRRPYVVLAYRGASRFHTTSSANLGELVRLAAERPGTRAVNCGDPEPPTVLEIGRSVARILDHEWVEVLLAGGEEVGGTPWSAPAPLVVDMTAADHELGYRPVTRYDEWLERTVEYLVAATRDRPWQAAFPVGARYLRFDYEAEDACVRSLAAR
ncbi:MAG: NAD-dependent epimerase/dehydratase family protein [Thermoleophilia bacterium]|nr:NAD-dependent epimerase/dehydratase family protein [Thermoleophilia bacterium]